jgi:hypothetical protein
MARPTIAERTGDTDTRISEPGTHPRERVAPEEGMMINVVLVQLTTDRDKVRSGKMSPENTYLMIGDRIV